MQQSDDILVSPTARAQEDIHLSLALLESYLGVLCWGMMEHMGRNKGPQPIASELPEQSYWVQLPKGVQLSSEEWSSGL